MRPSAILIKNPHHLNREEKMILRAYESSDCPSIAELFITRYTQSMQRITLPSSWMLGQPGKLTCPSGMPLFLPTAQSLLWRTAESSASGTWTAPAIWIACMSTKTAKGGESPPESAMFWNRPPRLSISPPMPPSLPGHSLSGAAGESSGSSR